MDAPAIACACISDRILAIMPRPPKAREPLKQAALQLFVERGIHATGIREIAKQAGCSEAALYRHWPNKETLVSQLFQEHLDHVIMVMHDARLAGEHLPEQIHAICAAMYRLYDEQPMVFRFVLLVQHEIARFLPEELETPYDVVIDILRAGQERGECRQDPVVLSAAMIGIFLQVASYVVYNRLPGPLTTYIDTVTAQAVALLEG